MLVRSFLHSRKEERTEKKERCFIGGNLLPCYTAAVVRNRCMKLRPKRNVTAAAKEAAFTGKLPGNDDIDGKGRVRQTTVAPKTISVNEHTMRFSSSRVLFISPQSRNEQYEIS